MTQDEPLFQIGIFPNCGPEAEQRFLFATEDRYCPIIEQGRIIAYDSVETLSLFRCERCGSNLLYSTTSDNPSGVSVDELDLSDPFEVAELDPATFQECSTLEWPLRRLALPSSVPENVRKIYEGAIKVKASSPDSFSVQIRRAIQAICINKGAKEYDQDGRHLDLVDNLRELSRSGVFPRQVTDVLHQLKYLGNIGAHGLDETVKPEIANIADELFRLLIQFIYEIPHKLDKLKRETQTLRFEDEKRRNQGR